MNIHLPFWCSAQKCMPVTVFHVFSRCRLFCGSLLHVHSGIWWNTWFGLPSFGPNPCGWLGTCFAHGVSVCPCSIVFQCRYSRTIQVNIKLLVLVCLAHGFVCFRFDFWPGWWRRFLGIAQIRIPWRYGSGTYRVDQWVATGVTSGYIGEMCFKEIHKTFMFTSSQPQYRQPPEICIISIPDISFFCQFIPYSFHSHM